MKRHAVRLAAAALAAGISMSEMAAIATLADYLHASDEAAVLPRVVVTPEGTRANTSAAPHERLVRATPLPPR